MRFFLTYVYVRVLNTRQWTSLRVLSTPYVYVHEKKRITGTTSTRIRFPSVFRLFSVLKGVENNGPITWNNMKTYTCGRGLGTAFTCEANRKLLVQAGFEVAPSGYRSDALPIELLSPAENGVLIPEGATSNPAWANNFPLTSQYMLILFTCFSPEDDRVTVR